MAEVYRVKVESDFLVLADDHQEAMTIASVLVDGINDELPGEAVAELYAYRIVRQDPLMRRMCVNFEGHADNQSSDAVGEEHAGT